VKSSANEHPLRPPSRTGRWVRLDDVGPKDTEFLYRLTAELPFAFRWRNSGPLPAPGQFAAGLWSGVLEQFIVVTRENGHPVGLVAAYGASQQNRHLHVGGGLLRTTHGSGLGVDAFRLFFQHLFATWDIKKIYVPAPQFTLLGRSSRAQRIVQLEATLTKHTYSSGRFWDQHIYAVYRDQFALETRIV
jgi:hypothetical protein